MRDNVRVNWLLDYYGGLLTEKQRDVLQLYYSDDLSLSEIAEELNVSRQAVHDSIRRGETQLATYEEKLGLVDRHLQITSRITQIHDKARSIITNDKEIRQLTKDIETLLVDIDY